MCLPYDALVDAHVLHFDGEWVDVTFEQQGSLVCGVVSSLSPFAVAEASADVAPDTTIIQAPADPTIQSTGDGAEVQFQFASTIDTVEHPAEFECRLDAAAWSSCDTPYRFNALFGEHTLRVRAVTDTGVRRRHARGLHLDGPRPTGRDDPVRPRGPGAGHPGHREREPDGDVRVRLRPGWQHLRVPLDR